MTQWNEIELTLTPYNSSKNNVYVTYECVSIGEEGMGFWYFITFVCLATNRDHKWDDLEETELELN